MADAAAISAASFASSSSNGGGSSSSSSPAEDDLRKQVHATLRSLQKREPLEPTYKKLLQSGSLTRRPAPIFKNKFYRRIPSRLRERVELYSREMEGKDPFDRISQRRPIDQDKLAVSMTLRAAKDHEQAPLLEATLAATAMHPERKRSLDGMALYLQKGMPKKKPRITSNRSTSPLPSVGAVSSGGGAGAEAGHNQAELDRQKEQARQWEEARKRREAEEKQRREDELAEEKRLRQREQERLHEEERMRHAPAPAPQASSGLHKIIDQSFQKLSELRFDYLPGERPFEVVIDRDVRLKNWTCGRSCTPYNNRLRLLTLSLSELLLMTDVSCHCPGLLQLRVDAHEFIVHKEKEGANEVHYSSRVFCRRGSDD